MPTQKERSPGPTYELKSEWRNSGFNSPLKSSARAVIGLAKRNTNLSPLENTPGPGSYKGAFSDFSGKN